MLSDEEEDDEEPKKLTDPMLLLLLLLLLLLMLLLLLLPKLGVTDRSAVLFSVMERLVAFDSLDASIAAVPLEGFWYRAIPLVLLDDASELADLLRSFLASLSTGPSPALLGHAFSSPSLLRFCEPVDDFDDMDEARNPTDDILYPLRKSSTPLPVCPPVCASKKIAHLLPFFVNDSIFTEGRFVRGGNNRVLALFRTCLWSHSGAGRPGQPQNHALKLGLVFVPFS